jgi:Ankyrin repeats (many copies)
VGGAESPVHGTDRRLRLGRGRSEKSSLVVVALLIDLRFDVNAINRTSPLHEAAMRDNLEMIELLA